MKTLEQFIMNIDMYNGYGITETERYELNKYGLPAFNKLTPEKQLEICAAYSFVYAQIKGHTMGDMKEAFESARKKGKDLIPYSHDDWTWDDFDEYYQEVKRQMQQQ